MGNRLDPNMFGLPSRTVIEESGTDTVVLVLDRKSRVIMADGKKVLAKAAKIKQSRPQARVVLRTTAPVCSKTRSYLAEAGIEVISTYTKLVL